MTRSPRPQHWWLAAGGVSVGMVAVAVGLLTGAPPLARYPVQEGAAAIPSRIADGIDRRFVMRDTVELQARQHVAASRGTVILLHGLGEHDSAYVRWAASVSKASAMNVIAYTLRGNGYGTQPAGDVTDPEAHVRDLAEVVRELLKRVPSGPVLLVGVRGGAGLAARYASDGLATPRPRVRGVAIVHPLVTRDALRDERIGHEATVQWHTRRLQLLDGLNRVSLTSLNRLPVAHQLVPASNGVAVRHYSYRALQALELALLWPSLRATAVPTLVLSATRPAVEAYPLSDRAEWAALAPGDDLASAAASAALARWTAQFSADATMPPAVLPYQPLPVLDKPPGNVRR
jgi:alpha-beta hydrolase superfamily lysophospholipase